MKTKIHTLLKITGIIILILHVAVYILIKMLFLRPPVYYDVGGWLSWIWLSALIVVNFYFSRLTSFYWHGSLIFIGFGGLLIIIFEKQIEIVGVKVINFGFIFIVAALISELIKHVKKK